MARKRRYTCNVGTIELQRSSALVAQGKSGPFLWLTADPVERALDPVHVHLSRSDVRRLRDALTRWLTDSQSL